MSNCTILSDSLNSNPNITVDQKSNFQKYFETIKYDIFDKYIHDYDFENSSFFIKNFKIVFGDSNEIIHYDKDSNSLVVGKSPNNPVFNTYKSLINLVSQSYNSNQNRCSSGLEVTIDGKTYGSKLNELLVDYIITINTHLSARDDNVESKINVDDVMVSCFEDIAGGAERLINYFAHGNGQDLYSEMVGMLGEDNAKQLYSDSVSVDRLLLSAQACKLKRKQIDCSTPKM